MQRCAVARTAEGSRWTRMPAVEELGWSSMSLTLSRSASSSSSSPQVAFQIPSCSVGAGARLDISHRQGEAYAGESARRYWTLAGRSATSASNAEAQGRGRMYVGSGRKTLVVDGFAASYTLVVRKTGRRIRRHIARRRPREHDHLRPSIPTYCDMEIKGSVIRCAGTPRPCHWPMAFRPPFGLALCNRLDKPFRPKTRLTIWRTHQLK